MERLRSDEELSGMVCRICGAAADKADAGFCTVCGAGLSDGDPGGRERGTAMFYRSIPTDENGKAAICPHCDNEDLGSGEFCMICGSNIVNRCADTQQGEGSPIVKSCWSVLPGNARYCPKCGNESTFYQRGWLKDWRSENTKRAIENANTTLDFQELRGGKRKGGRRAT